MSDAIPIIIVSIVLIKSLSRFSFITYAVFSRFVGVAFIPPVIRFVDNITIVSSVTLHCVLPRLHLKVSKQGCDTFIVIIPLLFTSPSSVSCSYILILGL